MKITSTSVQIIMVLSNLTYYALFDFLWSLKMKKILDEKGNILGFTKQQTLFEGFYNLIKNFKFTNVENRVYPKEYHESLPDKEKEINDEP